MSGNNMNQDVTNYIQLINQEWQVDICNRIREIIHQIAPNINEKIAMTTPNYSMDGKPFCTFFTAKTWVNLTIFYSTNLEIPEGLVNASDYPDRLQLKIKKGKEIDYEVLTNFMKLVAKQF
jgi:hypothetical protein